MPDALRWLWRGYPEPIVVHEPQAMHQPGWDPRGKVFATVDVDKPWQRVEGNYGWAVSPTADKNGNVYFADWLTGSIDKVTPDGAVTVFNKDPHRVTALRIGADGRLYASKPSLKQIVAYGADGVAKVVARDVQAWDFVVTGKGTIYFIDDLAKTVRVVEADGSARTVYDGGEIALPGGITLSPDQAMVIVTDALGRFAWSFQIGADGSLENGEPYYRLDLPEDHWESHVNGVATDASGAAYFATPGRIQISEPSGRVIEILNAPEPGPEADNLSGIAFAGTGPTWLYVVEGMKLYRRPVKVPYAPVWAPVKPPKPLL